MQNIRYILCFTLLFLFASQCQAQLINCTGVVTSSTQLQVLFEPSAGTCTASATAGSTFSDGDVGFLFRPAFGTVGEGWVGDGTTHQRGIAPGTNSRIQNCSILSSAVSGADCRVSLFGSGLGTYTAYVVGRDSSGLDRRVEVTYQIVSAGFPERFTLISAQACVGAEPCTSATTGITASARQSNANRAAGAAFSNASNHTQNFVTQTQTQNRLLDDGTSVGGQVGFTQNDNPARASSAQIAMAYGATIRRPGKNAWHSKDIFNHYRSKHLAGKRKKELQAKAGLQKLGVDHTSEVAQPEAYKSKWDIWAAGGATKVDSSRTGNAFDGDLIFGRTGFDYLITRNLLIGAFGGYDKGDADFESFRVKLDSKAKIAGSYFGYKLTGDQTGFPVDLILDGQGSYAWVDYDIRDNTTVTAGTFNATRFAGSINLTAVILRAVGTKGPIRILPKVGFTYTNEKQDAYLETRA